MPWDGIGRRTAATGINGKARRGRPAAGQSPDALLLSAPAAGIVGAWLSSLDSPACWRPGISKACASAWSATPRRSTRSIDHAADLVFRAPGVTLAALFGPQHGFRSDLQDNMIESPHASDAIRRVPVYSLYSDTREPTAEMMKGLDVLVVDLQDVGARIYTFIYTMANCLRAARRHGIPVIVCDRPNPIGGIDVEGPMLEPGYESFVGLFPIPMRHGMTIGELARLFNEAFGIGADLRVERVEGWTRDMYFDQTGLPWVMPSPNMPTLDTAIVYPGAVLFEGTQLSEGRGTTRPFEYLGAPWIDAEHFAEDLNALGLDGVKFRPIVFEPTFQKHARVTCGGCQIHVTDRRTFKPVLGGRRRDGPVPPREPGSLRVAGAALRIRAREDADRHPRRLAGAAAADRGGCRRAGDRGVVDRGDGGVREAPPAVSALLSRPRGSDDRLVIEIGRRAQTVPTPTPRLRW